MDLKLQELGVGQRTTPIDLFQNELEISEQQSALESLLDQCGSYLDTVHRLTAIKESINQYGWTQSMEALFGSQFHENNIECSTEGVAGAIGRGIAAFARALVNVIKKIITFVQNLLSKRDNSRMTDLGDLPNKIQSIQNEKMTDVTCPIKKEIITVSDIIKKHFDIKLESSKSNLGENAKIDVMRKAYVDEFNSKCGQEGKVNIADYKLVRKIQTLSSRRLREYGFISMQDLKAADDALQDAINGAKGVINDLKHNGEETSKIAKDLESHTFREGSADTAELQATYVFCRIIFNDLAILRRTNNQFSVLINRAKQVSKGYISTGKAPSKSDMEKESMDRDTTPEK